MSRKTRRLKDVWLVCRFIVVLVSVSRRCLTVDQTHDSYRAFEGPVTRVDGKDSAGHAAGLIAGQIESEPGNVFGVHDAKQMQRLDLTTGLRVRHPMHLRRGDKTGAD